MLINFQKRFALLVWGGKKLQTIRRVGDRKNVPVAGHLAHCYTGLRTVSTQLLGRFTITRVRELRMWVDENGLRDVRLDDQALGFAEIDALAKADGFDDAAAMEYWFESYHPPGEFVGWVVNWAWNPADCAARPVGCDV